MIGSSAPSSAGATNTRDLTIWPSSAPRAAAACCAVWVDSSNADDLEGHALARGGVEDAPDGGMIDRVQARPESSIGSCPTARPRRRRSIAGWQAHRPRRRRRSEPCSARRAPGRAGARRIGLCRRRRRRRRATRRRSACRSIAGSATATPSDPAALAALPPPASDRARAADKDESDTELAVRAALELGADDRDPRRARRRRASTTRWPTSRCWPAGARRHRRPRSSTRGARIAAARRRTGGRPPARAAGAASATSSRCCRSGGDVDGRDDDGLRYPLARRAAAAGPARGLSNVRDRADAAVDASGAAACSSSRPLLRSDDEHAAAGDPAPESPSPTRPGRSIAWPTSAAAGRSSTSTRRTTRPAAPSRRASSATPTRPSHERGADVWGISPQGADEQAQRSARSSTCRSRSSPTTDHAVAEAYGSWVEKQNYGKTYMGHRADDVPRRPGRADRPRLAEGQARGPRGRRPGRPRRAAGRARDDRRERPRGFARGGRRAKPRRKPSVEPERRRKTPTRRARLAPRSVHGHRRPSRTTPIRARRRPPPLDRRQGSVGWLVCCTSGDQGGEDPDLDPLELAATRERSSRPRPRSSATPGVTYLHQPDGALVNDLALREQLVREIRTFRPDAVLATDPETLFYRDGGVNHTDHRAAGHGRRRRRLSGGPQPDGVSLAGPRRARGPPRPAALPLLVEPRRTPGSTSPPRSTASSRRSRAHASQIHDRGGARRRGSASGPPRRGQAIGVAAAEALRLIVIDDDEDEGPGST